MVPHAQSSLTKSLFRTIPPPSSHTYKTLLVSNMPFIQEAVEDRVMCLAYCTVILVRLVAQCSAKGEEDLFSYGFATRPINRRSISLSQGFRQY